MRERPRQKTVRSRSDHPQIDRYAVGAMVGLTLMGVCGMAQGSGGDVIADDIMIVNDAVIPGFVAGFEDVPLPPGMTNLPGSQTVFDSREGRIIDATATGQADGSLTAKMVRDFYRQTLPQLGWQRMTPGEASPQDMGLAPDHFAREGEILVLELQSIGDVIQARFTLTPMPQSP